MAFYGKVIGGQHINATIQIDRKGELALSLGFKRLPHLTRDVVTSWQEIIREQRGGAAGAVSKMGQAMARATLPGLTGKAAAAAVGSAVDSAMAAPRTVRVDWTDGTQSLVELPDKLFQHLAIVLSDRQLATEIPPEAPPAPSATEAVIGQIAQLTGRGPTAPDPTEQLAKLGALRDAGVLTEEEFSAKKAEILSRI